MFPVACVASLFFRCLGQTLRLYTQSLPVWGGTCEGLVHVAISDINPKGCLQLVCATGSVNMFVECSSLGVAKRWESWLGEKPTCFPEGVAFVWRPKQHCRCSRRSAADVRQTLLQQKECIKPIYDSFCALALPPPVQILGSLIRTCRAKSFLDGHAPLTGADAVSAASPTSSAASWFAGIGKLSRVLRGCGVDFEDSVESRGRTTNMHHDTVPVDLDPSSLHGLMF